MGRVGFVFTMSAWVRGEAVAVDAGASDIVVQRMQAARPQR